MNTKHQNAHYLPFAGEKNIHLYGSKKLPAWTNEIHLDQYFQLHDGSLFDNKVSQLAFNELLVLSMRMS